MPFPFHEVSPDGPHTSLSIFYRNLVMQPHLVKKGDREYSHLASWDAWLPNS